MNLSGLSFNALPPIHLPFRFFLTLPVFAFASAILILSYGEDIFISRWHPAMLALTHGMTLGIISMVMMGALLQILPVVAGISVPKVTWVGSVSHGCLCVGSASLMLGFLVPGSAFLPLSFILLALGFAVYLVAIFIALMPSFRADFNQGVTLSAVRYAMMMFLFTIALGLMLLATRIGWWPWPSKPSMTDLHALLGGLGWMALLILAVSLQVVPMFHVAPNFSKRVSCFLPRVMVSFLLVLTVFTSLGWSVKPLVLLSLLAYGIFVIALLRVLSQRKRKVADITIRYWQFAAFSLLFVVCVLVFTTFYPWPALQEKKGMLLVGIFLYCFVLSVIQGLLLKICPFLSYTHLQQRCFVNFDAMNLLPHMHQFIEKKQANSLWWFHFISCVLLVVVMFFPRTYVLFSLAMLIEHIWLAYLLIRTVLLYRRTSRAISSLENL